MKKLDKELEKRKKELLSLLKRENEKAEEIPAGKIRIAHRGNTEQYYLVTEETQQGGKQGKYIKKEDILIVEKIINNEYSVKMIKAIESELKSIDRLLMKRKKCTLEKIYANLSPYRRKMITPLVLPDEMFVKEWEEKKYKGKSFLEGVAEIYSERGERVRSKSEKIIADLLYRHNIPYKYECPLQLTDPNGNFHTFYPDFTILDVKNRRELYLEHLGMMDVSDYARNAVEKINIYIKAGIIPGDQLIFSYETDKSPLDTRVVEMVLKSYELL